MPGKNGEWEVAVELEEVDISKLVNDLGYRPKVKPPALLAAVRGYLDAVVMSGGFRKVVDGREFCPLCQADYGHMQTCPYLIMLMEEHKTREQWVKAAESLGLDPHVG